MFDNLIHNVRRTIHGGVNDAALLRSSDQTSSQGSLLLLQPSSQS